MPVHGPELHHEPASPGHAPAPARVRIPGLAFRVPVPGRGLQRRLAAGVLALGLITTGLAAAGLLTAGQPGYALDAASPVVPAPHGSWAAPRGLPAAPRGLPAAPSRAAVPPPASARPVPRPVFLTIPSIGVRTPLMRLGLTAAGTLQVPPTATTAGWYTGSPAPGATGSAVIAGHVDSHAGPGVFFRLRLLRPGDRVYVRQSGGLLAVFAVTSVRLYAKSDFPATDVYGPAPAPQLRLVTCGGVFDAALGSYLSNVVVDAVLIG